MSTGYLPHELRVVEEKTQLKERLKKLDVFLYTVGYFNLSPVHQVLLKTQRHAMDGYLLILEERIRLFDDRISIEKSNAFNTLPDDYEAPH